MECKHYVRRCSLLAPCCNKVYVCRHCHNDAETHELDRHAVKEIVCNVCGQQQLVGNTCINKICGITFAAYFCEICNFYDDQVERNYYHCDKCGICRVKGENEYIHCDTCSACVSSSNHKCKSNQFHVNCSICMENLFHSIKSSCVIPCGHTMHVDCMQRCIQQNKTNCPLCRKSMLSPEAWTKYNELMDEIIQVFPIEEQLIFTILCNDCSFNGESNYHPHGMKCGQCGGYNTMRN